MCFVFLFVHSFKNETNLKNVLFISQLQNRAQESAFCLFKQNEPEKRASHFSKTKRTPETCFSFFQNKPQKHVFTFKKENEPQRVLSF